MTEWLDELAPKLGLDATLSDDEIDALLKIARIAAHTSDDRRNAPLLTSGKMKRHALFAPGHADALQRLGHPCAHLRWWTAQVERPESNVVEHR